MGGHKTIAAAAATKRDTARYLDFDERETVLSPIATAPIVLLPDQIFIYSSFYACDQKRKPSSNFRTVFCDTDDLEIRPPPPHICYG